MLRLNALGWTALILVVIGGINWGLVGIFEYNLVSSIFGEMSVWSRLIYIIVGIAALYEIIDAFAESAHKKKTTQHAS